jgi:hypothetical protein
VAAMLLAAALAAPKPTPAAALKPYYPSAPVQVLRLCRIRSLALAVVRVGSRSIQAVLLHGPKGWRVLWLDGRLVKGVPQSRLADVMRLRTRCTAP